MPPKCNGWAIHNTRKHLHSFPMTEPSSSYHSQTISKARQRIINDVAQGHSNEHDGTDLNLTICAVEALVTTNHEIFNRIMGSLSYDGINGTVFRRCGFERVKVRQVLTKTQFTTFAEYSTMTFDLSPLKRLPAALGILQPVYQTRMLGFFIDYEHIVQSALGALHEDVLLPFLTQLKRHLETIQVCLGEVDSWLLDAESNLRFIESTFGKKLEIRGESTVYASITPSDCFVAGTDRCLSNQPCENCCFLLQMHQCELIAGYYYRRCPHSPKLVNGFPSFYSYQKEVILLECEFTGRFEVSFDISHDTEQLRLLRLLDFMAH